MNKLNYLIGLACLGTVFACSDNLPLDNSVPELPSLPTDIITGDRLMWVSYDPAPDEDANSTTGIHGALVSWRMLPTDPAGTAFDIYKSTANNAEEKLNSEPITDSSCWIDEDVDPTKENHYRVTLTGEDETLCETTFTSQMAQTFYREIKLDMNVPNASVDYQPDDVQVGELDGDGWPEIVIKREPYDGANQGGWYGGTTLLEAYKLDGTFLWRIDLGINIRSGSHYTSFILYDFDGDGLCEIAFRSSEGTTFGDGKTITNEDGTVHDYRIHYDEVGWYSGSALPTLLGLILGGPEYISLCRGYDGREICRTDNIPRGGTGSKASRAQYWQEYWGDDYGNRMDRFFIGAAYLDGIPDETTGTRTSNPSLIITRGIYLNWQVWALDFKDNELVARWQFDTADGHAEKWLAMGAHAFRVADLDEDGKDEILYGSAAIDDDGGELWCTGNGHGDILSVGKFIKDRQGLQVQASFEEEDTYSNQGLGYGCQILDARNGNLISGHGAGPSGDVGRSIVADIDPDSPNFEYWSSLNTGVYNCASSGNVPLEGVSIPTGIGGGSMYNVAIWWSGELTRELYDRALIVSAKANPMTNKNRLVNFNTGYGTNQGNHGTKYNPCYYGDMVGDWREEVILPSEDNTSIRIFSTNYPTSYRFTALTNDHTYDMSQTMQNMGYNQQTNIGFYLGADKD